MGSKRKKSKKFVVRARRKNGNWSTWIETDNITVAREQFENVTKLGYFGKIYDRELKNTILITNKRKVGGD